MENKTSRFWEYYLVRYLAGNIAAVIILLYLGVNYKDDINKSFKDNNKTKTINFVQKVNSTIFQSSQDINLTNDLKINFGKDTERVILKKGASYHITNNELTFEGIFIIFIFAFLYMYISSIPIYFFHIIRGFFDYLDNGGIYKFYRDTTEARLIEKLNEDAFVESYKHMREHGNAFGIIIMEILFSGYLIYFNFRISAIIFWLLFGFFGWFLATYLEFKMIYEYKNNKKENFWFLVLSFGGLLVFIFLIYLIGCN